MAARKNRNSGKMRSNPSTVSVAKSGKRQSFNWKDHPLAVAALAVAGTFAATAFAFLEIVIPTQTARIENQIADLPGLRAQVETLELSTSAKDRQINDLKRKIEVLEQRGLFSSGNPFPIAFSRVRIGQPIVDLEDAYRNFEIERREGFWTVRPDHGVFRSITYYFDERSSQHTITHASFFLELGNDFGDHFLQDQIVAALGNPTSNPRGDFFEWRLEDYSVFKTHSSNFLILPAGMHPGYWPTDESSE